MFAKVFLVTQQLVNGVRKASYNGFIEIATNVGSVAKVRIPVNGLVGIYVTVISVLSMLANTVKEAGAYITPAYMAVMIAGFMIMFGSGEVSELSYYIPVYNNIINMQQILLGNGNLIRVLVSFGTSVILTLLMIGMSRKLMHREKVMFPS